MAGYRPVYTHKEDVAIIQYIIQEKGYYNLRGNAFWKKMEEARVTQQRTYQSLKEHFRKKIINKLHKAYFREIDEEELQKIKRGYNGTALENKQSEPPPVKEADLSKTPPTSSDSDTD